MVSAPTCNAIKDYKPSVALSPFKDYHDSIHYWAILEQLS